VLINPTMEIATVMLVDSYGLLDHGLVAGRGSVAGDDFCIGARTAADPTAGPLPPLACDATPPRARQ
jgi:hypothetical protein